MILQRDPGRNRTTCWSNWKPSPTFAPRKTKGKPKRKTRENQGKPRENQKGKPKGKTKKTKKTRDSHQLPAFLKKWKKQVGKNRSAMETHLRNAQLIEALSLSAGGSPQR